MAAGRANFRKRAEQLQKQDNPFAKKRREDSEIVNETSAKDQVRQRRLALVRSNADIINESPAEEIIVSGKKEKDVEEIYREVIAKSKEHRAARQALKEADQSITRRLDESLVNVVGSLGLRDATEARLGKNEENTFRALKEDLVSEKHLAAGNRVKTAEEEAEEARENLLEEAKKRESRRNEVNETGDLEDDFGDVLSDDFMLDAEGSLGSEDVEFEDDEQDVNFDDESDEDIEAKEGISIETSLEEFLEMTESLDSMKALLKSVELSASKDIDLVAHVISLLIEALLVKCDSEDITQETISVYFKSIYFLANSAPIDAAKYMRRSLAALMHSMGQSIHKSVPSLKGLILIRLAFVLFPPQDAWHSVATPAFLIGEFVSSYALFDSPKSIIAALFLAQTLYSAVDTTQFSLVPLNLVTRLWQSLKNVEFTGEKTPLKLSYLVSGTEIGDCSESFYEALQQLTLMILDSWSQKDEVCFSAITKDLRAVLVEEEQNELVDVIDGVASRIDGRKTGVCFIKEKVIKIKEYEPRISSKFK